MAEVCQVAPEETTRGFWTNKAKEEMFGHTAQHHVWQKQIPHVKHAGTGRVMIWVCFAAWKLGALHSLS